MQPKNVLILSPILIIATAGLTRYYFPQIQEKTVVQEKEVVKVNVVTKIKKITDKEGNVVEEKEITDNTIINKDKKLEHLVASKSQWLFGAKALSNLKDSHLEYGISAQKRILGPFFVGLEATSDKHAGLLLTMEF